MDKVPHKKFKQTPNKMLKYFENFPDEERDKNGENGLVVAMNTDNGKLFGTKIFLFHF